MNFDDLIRKFSDSTEHRQKAIFSTLFIVSNRLQTLFDSRIPELSLKQFMLLSIVRQTERPLTLTQLGDMLGCSRQNIRKLADALERKGFVALRQSPQDPRALCLFPTARATEFYEHDFSGYQEELKYLFEVYTDEQLQTLFELLSKLYGGMENMEKKVAGKHAAATEGQA